MDPVVHFEMPARNRKRVADFYTKVFGWKMTQLGPEMGNYLLANTTETDDKGMVKTPGAINGGFWETKEDNPPHIVISVDNLEEATKKVNEAGGKVLGGSKGDGTPDDIPGVGLYSSFIDSEGNRVGMLQPSPMPQPDKKAK
ncbi:VOC family protein [Candidatus Daviesbacteria bacterium]|nr:VOC family protein [Candidatus Daviesbacteria bacterium]